MIALRMKCILPVLWVPMIFSSCSREETVTPQRVDLIDAVFAIGHIILENEYQVAARAEGYLLKSNVEIGDSIIPGEPLFELTYESGSDQLASAEANYSDALRNLAPDAPQQAQLRLQIEQARSQQRLDQSHHDRLKKLAASGAVSLSEFERAAAQLEYSVNQVQILEESLEDFIARSRVNLKQAESQLAIQRESFGNYTISGYRAGQLLNVYKEEGELVRRGEVIARIGGGRPSAKLFIAEEDIERITVGDEVLITLNTSPDDALEAFITRVYPAFDEIEQSFVCVAEFEQSSTVLAQTRLQANIVVGKREDVMAIPTACLLPGDSVISESGQVMALATGLRDDHWVEVIGGLIGDEALIKHTGK